MSDDQKPETEAPEEAKPKRGRRLSDYTTDSNVPPVVPLVDADTYLADTAGPEDQAPAPGRWGAGDYPEHVYEQRAAVERRYQAPPPAVPAARQLPWMDRPGPYYGQPRPYPNPADVLDRRRVTRRPLHLSVPEDLALDRRLRDFAHYCDVDVPGDVLAVALDEWLSRRGY